jgi:outer membrane protein OmpA-like peptidoglycan-associated protein
MPAAWSLSFVMAWALVPAVAAWAEPPASLADRLKAVQSGEPAVGTRLPAWKPVPAGAVPPPIPLVTGLTVVTAIHQDDGDYESIKSVTGIDAAAVTMRYSANRPKIKDSPLLQRPDDLGQADPMREFPTKLACVRTIDLADLQKAVGYSEVFCAQPAEHFPGSTAISASSDLLAQLRAGKTVDFHFAQGNRWDELAQLGAQMSGEKPDAPLLTRYANFYWLDQAANPVTLAFALDQWLLQTIKITIPRDPPRSGEQSALERALTDRKPVQIYGIYFDFDSATITPESDAVLQEIADLLRRNPDWHLTVNGHTDNIGGGAANTLLSQRRSAAVKAALVGRYHIDPARLVTGGFGAAQPVATNDTLEGRARNRRVELQRQ